MEDRDRLRREQAPPGRRSRLPSTAARVGTKIVGGLARGAGSFISRGGIRHPDSMITRGSNRSLYVTEGRQVSPLPGGRPNQGKELLTGRPNSNPGPSRRRKTQKNTYNQMMRRARKSILGK